MSQQPRPRIEGLFKRPVKHTSWSKIFLDSSFLNIYLYSCIYIYSYISYNSILHRRPWSWIWRPLLSRRRKGRISACLFQATNVTSRSCGGWSIWIESNLWTVANLDTKNLAMKTYTQFGIWHHSHHLLWSYFCFNSCHWFQTRSEAKCKWWPLCGSNCRGVLTSMIFLYIVCGWTWWSFEDRDSRGPKTEICDAIDYLDG